MAVVYLKGKSVIQVYRQILRVKKEFTGEHVIVQGLLVLA